MKRVLAIAAHPDDIEFLMAGTMLHLAAQGYELHYLNLANGCCGTTQFNRETIIAMRRREAMAAAAAMSAHYHESLCDDLGIFYEPQTLAKLAAIVRQVAPEIVLTHAPVDYMEDHTATCRLAVTAAFARGMPNFATIPPVPAISQVVAIYHAQPYSNHTPLGEPVYPSLFVETTSRIAQKISLLAKHESQKRWLDESQGLDSYLETLRSLDQQVGTWSGRFQYAEGWRKHAPTGFGPPDWDPLAIALRDVSLAAPSGSVRPAGN